MSRDGITSSQSLGRNEPTFAACFLCFRSDASDERKTSFHISLDALMSHETGGAPACTDQVLHAVRPEMEKTEEIKVSEVLADSNAAIEKSDPANGVSLPKPMDLSVSNSEARRNKAQDDGGKTEPLRQIPRFTGPAHAVPAPANMAHLHNPTEAMSFIPPPPLNVPFSKDLNSKLPQGGMLNLLYSGYSGDTSPLPPAVAMSVEAQHTSKESTGIHKLITAPELRYPYNPVAEHFKRMPPGAHPYLPKTVEPQKPLEAVARVTSLQSKEDDDYDT